MPDAYTLLQVAEAVGVIAVGIGSAFFSRKAAKHSEPTSNGWTAGLGRRLDRQDQALSRIEEKIDDHYRWHLDRTGDK